MKALDECFLMVLFVLLLKRVHFLVNETQRCDHSNESSRWVLSHGTVCFITEESSFSCEWNPKVWPLKWKLSMSTFSWYCLFYYWREFIFLWMKPKGVTTQMKALDEYFLMVLFVLLLKRVHFLVNETQRCDHSNESSRWVLSHGGAFMLLLKKLFTITWAMKVMRSQLKIIFESVKEQF